MRKVYVCLLYISLFVLLAQLSIYYPLKALHVSVVPLSILPEAPTSIIPFQARDYLRTTGKLLSRGIMMMSPQPNRARICFY